MSGNARNFVSRTISDVAQDASLPLSVSILFLVQSNQKIVNASVVCAGVFPTTSTMAVVITEKEAKGVLFSTAKSPVRLAVCTSDGGHHVDRDRWNGPRVHET